MTEKLQAVNNLKAKNLNDETEVCKIMFINSLYLIVMKIRNVEKKHTSGTGMCDHIEGLITYEMA